MKNLFNLENPVLRAMDRLADLVMLGQLCLLCCIPIVTAGPAFVALFSVYDLTTDRGGGIVKNYFRAFRSNFKQAVIVWIPILLFTVSLICDWILLRMNEHGTFYTVLICVVLAILVLAGGILSFAFPLISRYSNTVWEHIHNAMLLMIQNIPKTLLMVLIQVLPLLSALFLTDILLRTLLLWILFYPGLSAQINVLLIRPVFENMEKQLSKSE